MGMRESLMVDFENTTMEFQGKNFYIAKQFDYEGKTYLYGVDIDVFHNENQKIEAAFLYRVQDDIFSFVSDMEMFDKLLNYVSGLFIGELLNSHLPSKNNQ